MTDRWIKLTAPQMAILAIVIISVLCLGSCILCQVMGMFSQAAGLLTPTPKLTNTPVSWSTDTPAPSLVPTNTPLPTNTPYIAPTLTPVPAMPDSSKDDGYYTVGIEIAPGRWESTGSGQKCYWERLDNYQEILDNHFGMAGGTVTILSTDYEVHFKDCGIWEYLGP